MKVLIAGAGSVGIAIAEDLSGKGYDIVVMEQDQAVVDKVDAMWGELGLPGSGGSIWRKP